VVVDQGDPAPLQVAPASSLFQFGAAERATVAIAKSARANQPGMAQALMGAQIVEVAECLSRERL